MHSIEPVDLGIRPGQAAFFDLGVVQPRRPPGRQIPAAPVEGNPRPILGRSPAPTWRRAAERLFESGFLRSAAAFGATTVRIALFRTKGPANH